MTARQARLVEKAGFHKRDVRYMGLRALEGPAVVYCYNICVFTTGA